MPPASNLATQPSDSDGGCVANSKSCGVARVGAFPASNREDQHRSYCRSGRRRGVEHLSSQQASPLARQLRLRQPLPKVQWKLSKISQLAPLRVKCGMQPAAVDRNQRAAVYGV